MNNLRDEIPSLKIYQICKKIIKVYSKKYILQYIHISQKKAQLQVGFCSTIEIPKQKEATSQRQAESL